MQDDARTKLGLVFTIMAYFSFSALNALPGIIADRAVYYYQRDGKYYKPLPYLLSNILAEVLELCCLFVRFVLLLSYSLNSTQIPMTVIETLLFCSITYWMTGLNSGGDRFIYFLLICGAYYFVRFAFLRFDSSCARLTAHRALIHLQMTRAFNRFIACIAPDLNAAQGISPVFTALSVLFGGYMITRVRLKSKLPNHIVWVLYVTNKHAIIRLKYLAGGSGLTG
jgi:hypothetical protein